MTKINKRLELIRNKGTGMVGFRFTDKNLTVRAYRRKDFKMALKCVLTRGDDEIKKAVDRIVKKK